MANGCRDWLRDQNRASYKGVQFEVTTDAISGGRRLVRHEYPTREFWDDEDLGRRAPDIQVSGYVHGDDADLQAQTLLRVCNEPGSGALILPHRATVMARCERIASTWIEDQLGRINFEASFKVVSTTQGGIVPLVLLTQHVLSAAAAAETALTAEFSARYDAMMRRFSPLGLVPSVARAAAARTIVTASEHLAGSITSVRLDDAAEASEVRYAMRIMRSDAARLAATGSRGDVLTTQAYVRDQVHRPATFPTLWSGTLDRIEQHAVDPKECASAMGTVAAFTAPIVLSGPNCRSVRAEQTLTNEIADYVRRTALLNRVRSAGRVPYASRPEAAAARAQFLQEIIAETESIADPGVAIEFSNTGNALSRLLDQAVAERPDLVQVDLPQSMPAVTLAYRLYGDAEKDRDIVERNRVTHPGFLPASLQVFRPPARDARNH